MIVPHPHAPEASEKMQWGGSALRMNEEPFHPLVNESEPPGDVCAHLSTKDYMMVQVGSRSEVLDEGVQECPAWAYYRGCVVEKADEEEEVALRTHMARRSESSRFALMLRYL